MRRTIHAKEVSGGRRQRQYSLRLICWIAVVFLSLFGQFSMAAARDHSSGCSSMVSLHASADHATFLDSADLGDGGQGPLHSLCSSGACLPIGLRDIPSDAAVLSVGTDVLEPGDGDTCAGLPVSPGYRPPISI